MNYKPCPFCGDRYIMVHTTKGGGYTIGCNTLNCVCLYTEGKLFKSEEDAAESWNKRTMPDEICLYCSHSMSADDEDGNQVLVCSQQNYKVVDEDDCCWGWK